MLPRHKILFLRRFSRLDALMLPPSRVTSHLLALVVLFLLRGARLMCGTLVRRGSYPPTLIGILLLQLHPLYSLQLHSHCFFYRYTHTTLFCYTHTAPAVFYFPEYARVSPTMYIHSPDFSRLSPSSFHSMTFTHVSSPGQ